MSEAGSEEKGAVYVRVGGRVQGVGFRMSTVREASRLGLVGYVANRWDGTVEVLAEGPTDALRHLVSWLHAGPPFAQVEDVQWRWQKPTSHYERFEVH